MTPLEFRPDLIVEATNACDRVCPGCYAPNIVVKPGAAASTPGAIHLSPESLGQAWPQGHVGTVSIRGGEPTLNPLLAALLQLISERASAVYLETNGSWISPESPLLAALSASGCVVKLSLDNMHGTSADEAQRKLAVLSQAGVQAAVAITESTPEQFQQTRARLIRGFQGEVFWQKKAASQAELTRPAIGVISAKGQLEGVVLNLLKDAPPIG